MTKNPHVSGRSLVWLAGGRRDIVDDVPGSATRFAALGGVLLSTAAVASVSAAFAVRMAVGAPVVLAVVVGVAWGVLILNLDRMLVVGMGNERSLRLNIGMAIPRLMLALILGTVISTPLTLEVFHKEIDAELKIDQQAAADAFKTQLGDDVELRQIPDLRTKIQSEKQVVDSGGRIDPSTDPRVIAAQSTLSTKQSAYNSAQQEYSRLQAAAQCELNGTCGTHIPGDGEAYRQAKAAADRQLAVVDRLFAELNDATADLASAQRTASADATGAAKRTVATAAKDLATDQKKLDSLIAKQDSLQRGYEALAGVSDGLLARLQALEAIGAKKFMMRLAQVLLAALFVCIEILPVMMKLLVNLGQPTAYDQVLATRDGKAGRSEEQRIEDELAQERAAADAERAAQDDRRAKRLEVQKHRNALQRDAEKRVNEEVFRQQAAVITSALVVWREHAQRRAEQQLAEYESELSTAPAPVASQAPVTGDIDGSAWRTAPQHRGVNGKPNKFVQVADLPDPKDL